jgi:signal transduction histidine kinase
MQGILGELRQIFSNLLTNSLDAIDTRGRISIRANRCSWNRILMARVAFADSGCGIDRGLVTLFLSTSLDQPLQKAFN